jgi:hypothetical protein
MRSGMRSGGAREFGILCACRQWRRARGCWVTVRPLSAREGVTPGAPIPDEPGRQSADDVLTREQVAALLQVKPRQVERLGVPVLDLGRRTKRYLRNDVLAWLEAQRRPRRLDRAEMI